MKVISQSARWPGSVTISDQLTLPQVELIEAALEPPEDAGQSVFLSALDKRTIPAIIACADQWELEHFPCPPTLDSWPMHARKESHELIMQLWDAVMRIYLGEQEVPNA